MREKDLIEAKLKSPTMWGWESHSGVIGYVAVIGLYFQEYKSLSIVCLQE